MTRKPRFTRGKIVLSTAFLALAASGTAACASDSDGDEQDFKAYCTDGQGNVVDEDRCDNDSDGGSGFFFVMVSSSHSTTYAPGQRVPANVVATKFASTDRDARGKWGLPKTGRVTNGTIKTGIVGKRGGAPVGKAGGGSSATGAKGSSATS